MLYIAFCNENGFKFNFACSHIYAVVFNVFQFFLYLRLDFCRYSDYQTFRWPIPPMNYPVRTFMQLLGLFFCVELCPTIAFHLRGCMSLLTAFEFFDMVMPLSQCIMPRFSRCVRVCSPVPVETFPSVLQNPEEIMHRFIESLRHFVEMQRQFVGKIPSVWRKTTGGM